MSAAPVSAAGCSSHLQSNILLTLEQSWTRAFIAQESTTAALHHKGSKDSSQCVFPTLLYIIKPSAEPRLTPQVSSSVLSREAGERHLNSLKLKREMSWWTGDCGFVLTQELLGQSATSQMRSGFMNCASPAINSFQGDKDTSKGLFLVWVRNIYSFQWDALTNFLLDLECIYFVFLRAILEQVQTQKSKWHYIFSSMLKFHLKSKWKELTDSDGVK